MFTYMRRVMPIIATSSLYPDSWPIRGLSNILQTSKCLRIIIGHGHQIGMHTEGNIGTLWGSV